VAKSAACRFRTPHENLFTRNSAKQWKTGHPAVAYLYLVRPRMKGIFTQKHKKKKEEKK
jgi:hypothetical protein